VEQPDEDVEVHTIARVAAAGWPPHTHLPSAIERTDRRGLRVIFVWPDKTVFWWDTLYYPN
jgi:hypothetical protein